MLSGARLTDKLQTHLLTMYLPVAQCSCMAPASSLLELKWALNSLKPWPLAEESFDRWRGQTRHLLSKPSILLRWYNLEDKNNLKTQFEWVLIIRHLMAAGVKFCFLVLDLLFLLGSSILRHCLVQTSLKVPLGHGHSRVWLVFPLNQAVVVMQRPQLSMPDFSFDSSFDIAPP